MTETIFDKVHAQRLNRLANRLDSNEPLGVGTFDFTIVFNNHGDCGTVGCALGECPFLWPEQWSEVEYFGYFMTGTKFFAITMDEYKHLFYPDAQDTEKFGGESLDGNATRYDVARNIREFLKTKGAGA